MIRANYNEQIKNLNDFINDLLEENSIRVGRIDHGFSKQKIELDIYKQINETTITKGITLIVDLDIEFNTGDNIYSEKVINSIKRCIDKDKLKDTVKKLSISKL